MAHGTPDWGLVGPKRTTYGLDDMGELAVRLGSPSTWDRRGDVLCWSDFRDGVGELDEYWSVVGYTIELVTEHSRQGAYAIKVTTDDEMNSRVGLRMFLPLPVHSGYGAEMSFSGSEEDVWWEVCIHWITATDQWQSRIRVDFLNWPDCQLQYLNAAGTYTDVGDTVQLVAYEQPEHVMKLVVDMAAGPPPEYVRAILNGVTHDLRGIPVRRVGGGGPLEMWTLFVLETQTAHNREGYLDCVIVTENEPT